MSDDAIPLRLTLVTPPPTEPVTVEEAKAHARIDEDDDQPLVAGLIATAREMAEDYTRRAFITQTWKMFLDAWPVCGFVELPKAPLQSVTHIKTYDDADVPTTFDSVYYFVDTATRPGRITLRTTGSWPAPARVANGIEIQFIAGYGNAPSNVPSKVKHGILGLIAWLYEHRGDEDMTPPDAVYAPLVGERTWLV
jgi:uncharacterized phiE125 gp8 family phage protein